MAENKLYNHIRFDKRNDGSFTIRFGEGIFDWFIAEPSETLESVNKRVEDILQDDQNAV
jgi:hypothetical protein